MRVAKDGLPTFSVDEEWVARCSLKEFLSALSGRVRGWSDDDLKQAYYDVRGEKPKKKNEEGGE